ncbi:MAG: hypothetical protein JSW64_03600 [Candidatus Zixiibacteriota bacterium]|nr:MAG: hypothetical protein JSW64_03600 [candidate division Zixibacteria bacterium]
MFEPFKMPDFCSRPGGSSRTLKEAYVLLRRREVPDNNIFIFPQGEFSRFKGEILEQQPHAGDTIYQDSRITLIAAVSGICHILPDLFTDQMSDFLSGEDNPRQGAKNLFAIFDSMFLKMRCRLEWIRDIYAGVYQSSRFIDYLNSIFFVPEREASKSNLISLGFMLSRLSRFQGTEGALRVFLESLTGLKVNAEILGNLKMAIPPDAVKGLGSETSLGEDLFLGDRFESEKPELELSFQLQGPEDVQKAIKITEDREILEDICRYALPFYLGRFETTIDPDSVGIDFTCGNSYLGFSTSMNPGERERG